MMKGYVKARQVAPKDRELRFGVSMPAIKARIVDEIVRAGEAGASAEQLVLAVYNGNAGRGEATIKTHISAINQLFVECDTRIRCQGGRYRIVQGATA